ncbi:uncharacterized protein Z519_00222 [Cladophialophora bantiana CBS 173.52]|uniref:HhH-GPD domain-containing protein n=1 Tax=Cladophialophora bantiana (strain ATCC 10958 / CBS 173.52 / CDC B-1940 / NIH 8579) TaxID=1442370 RepID=A0A0D2F914_CLAB1|nr:uncharacterized protein Z519_00222 [Cladophialophora bantiana CBS 173.52]KIW98561.1 hypothetical protein Z519_00222 [Cladophialophora bantiana CBS 173.52]
MARTRAQSRASVRGEAWSSTTKEKPSTAAYKPISPIRKHKLGHEELPPEKAKKRKTARRISPTPKSGDSQTKGATEDAEMASEKVVEDEATTNQSITHAKFDALISKYGKLPLSDIDLSSPNQPTPGTILAHILNALLSSARISHNIAKQALRNLISRAYHDFSTLKASTWKERVTLLDEAGYVRYDFKTATELGKLATLLKNKYGSDATKILPVGHDPTATRNILAKRLMEINGLGPLGVEIFISTVQMIWPAVCPFITSRDLKIAEQIGLGKDVDVIYDLVGKDPEKMARLSSALSTIRLEKHVGEFI